MTNGSDSWGSMACLGTAELVHLKLSLSRKLAVLQQGWQSCLPHNCWPAVNGRLLCEGKPKMQCCWQNRLYGSGLSVMRYRLSLKLRQQQKDDDAVMVFSGNTFQQRLKSLRGCFEVLVDSLEKKKYCESLTAKASMLFLVFFLLKQPIFVEISSLHEITFLDYCWFVTRSEKV